MIDTPRERFLATLRGDGDADFVPAWEVWFCMGELADNLQREAGLPEPSGPGARLQRLLPAAKRLGWCWANVGGAGAPVPRHRETASGNGRRAPAA